jgi:hypothetical protein
MQPFTFIKSLFFWERGRNSIVYEIVCAVYIGLLVFLPVNSSGWFNPGEQVELGDTSVTLQRQGTILYLTWEGDRPDADELWSYAVERFGRYTVLIGYPPLGQDALRIVPGGWQWSDPLP